MSSSDPKPAAPVYTSRYASLLASADRRLAEIRLRERQLAAMVADGWFVVRAP